MIVINAVWIVLFLLVILAAIFFVRARSRTLRWIAGGIGLFALLFLCFYLEENWRGLANWKQCQKKWSQKGFPLQWKAFGPTPVPEEKNFCAIPYFKKLLQQKPLLSTPLSDEFSTNPPLQTSPVVISPRMKKVLNNYLLETGDLFERVNLLRWYAAFRETWPQAPTNLVAKPPEKVSISEAARLVLEALKDGEPILQSLRTAARTRPYAYPLNPTNLNALLQYYLATKTIGQTLHLHASALFALGKGKEAMDDLQVLFRLTESFRAMPTLVSHLVNLDLITDSLLSILWEGLGSEAWSDDQLQSLQKQLAGIDLLKKFQRTCYGECLFSIHMVESRLLSDPTAPSLRTPGLTTFTFSLIPKGWYRLLQADIADYHLVHWYHAVDAQHHLVNPTTVSNILQNINGPNGPHRSHPVLRRLFLTVLNTAWRKAVIRTAYTQELIDMAQVAIALERYFRKEKTYPQKLEVLVPQYLPKLPHDLITGKPLHYRRLAPDRYLLYSVGWNLRDDGGKPSPGQMVSSLVVGDWVWKCPRTMPKTLSFQPLQKPSLSILTNVIKFLPPPPDTGTSIQVPKQSTNP